MKKLLMMVLCLSAAGTMAFAADDQPITVDQLPKSAQAFLKTHFAGVAVSHAKIDKELTSTDYDVVLANGFKVEFDGKGKWKDVDAPKGGEVSHKIVPTKIADYVKANYADRKIEQINRDTRDYEVELDNGLDLKFDLKFKFLGLDE